jgi:hypothetical protein
MSNPEALRRHIRSHGYSLQEYTLKWKWEETRPHCVCGCGSFTNWNVASKDYARYADGHGGKSTLGRKRTEAEKLAIGSKNHINSKQWCDENPDKMMEKIALMLKANEKPENIEKRLTAVREAYRNMTSEKRNWWSEHYKKLWREQRLLMDAAHTKAASTFKQRAAAGEYDFQTRNANLSKSITRLYLDGGFQWCVGDYTSSKTGETIFYRSSWELEYAKLLDADDTVIMWEYEPFAIKYVHGKKTKNYLPDFLVTYSNGAKELVEVKPRELESNAVNQTKRLAALDLCNRNGWCYAGWSIQ